MSVSRSGALSAPSFDISNLDRKNNGSLLVSAQSTLPVWIPDSEASNCMLCNKKFATASVRKHHCRSCGFVICNNCSLSRVQLPQTSGRVRCCDRCVKDLQQKPVALPVGGNVAAQSQTSLPASTASTLSSRSSASFFSPQAATPAIPDTKQPLAMKQWAMQVEKEREMMSILDGQSNGYSNLVDLYQSPDLTANMPVSGEVIPHEFTGLGVDVPDWAYIFSNSTSHQTRIGRLRLHLHDLEQLVLNNITLIQPNPTDPSSLKVKDASLAAFIALGTTYHQTTPVDIGIASAHDNTSGMIKSAKGVAKIEQDCVFDVLSATQMLRLQIVINKTTPGRTSDGTPIPEQTLTIPIGFLNIPISSLKPNTKHSFTLTLTPTTPQQLAALTGTPTYLHKSSPDGSAASTASSSASQTNQKKSTLKLDLELICSQVGYTWSLYNNSKSAYGNAVTTPVPPLTLHYLTHYSLLILHAFRPILVFTLSTLQLLSWSAPLFTCLFMMLFLFEIFYPIPMTLLICHFLLLRLIIAPLFDSTSKRISDPTASVQQTSQHDHITPLSNISTGSLHQISLLAPDADNPLAQHKPTQADFKFVDILVDFLENVLPMINTSSVPVNPATGKPNPLITGPTPQSTEINVPNSQHIFSSSSLSNLYRSLYIFHSFFITPFQSVISWQSLATSIVALVIVAISLFSVFFVPSHYIYIVIGLFPFVYHSSPFRLIKALLSRQSL